MQKPRTTNHEQIMLKYFISREFLITILSLIGLGVLAYLLIFLLILPAYTRHGDGVLVPNIQRMSYEEAAQSLKKANLRFEVKDSSYQKDFDPLTVLDQYPAPLSRVKPGRKVFLTLNRRSVPQVKMPIPDPYTKESISLYQAKTLLESWNLNVGTVTSASSPFYRNHVVEVRYNGQVIQEGTQVPQGAMIDLVVSKGNTINAPLPNLIGLSLQEALEIVRSYDLAIGSTSYKPGDDPFKDGLIIMQSPDARSRDSISTGESINIIIQGQPEENLEAPTGETVDDDAVG